MIINRIKNSSTKDKIDDAIKNIPEDLFENDDSSTGKIDLGRFRKGKNGNKVHEKRKKWTLEKDYGNHWGKSGYKLKKMENVLQHLTQKDM